MEHSGFPSEETLAAFIDGGLDSETRQRVVAHMTQCSECYETFLGAGEWGRGESKSSVTSAVPRVRKFRLGVTIGIAAALSIVVYGPLRRWNDERVWSGSRGKAALVVAANQLSSRLVDVRLTGGFDYKPIVRASGDRASAALIEPFIERGTRTLQDSSSTAQLQALASAHLMLGHADDSIRLFQKAIEKESGFLSLGDAIDHSRDPELLNDLGAALSTRYSVTHSTDDLRNAVRALDRAWTMSPSAETAWNRAVTAELAEPSRAARLWADYVALDSTSRWGREAMLRMRRVGS